MDHSVPSISPEEASGATFPIILDVRSSAGTTPTIPGAVPVSPEDLTSEPQRFIPEQDADILVVCDLGIRSSSVVGQLQDAGYMGAVSLDGGLQAWLTVGLAVQTPEGLSAEDFRRYDRQLKLPGLGINGQRALQSARVAIVGAGGLGAPVIANLAGAGVGHMTIIDSDDVEVSNLHRQPIYRTDDVGMSKAAAAAAFAVALNPGITVVADSARLDGTNASDLLAGHDLVVTCTDSFHTAHVINAAAVHARIPMVFGSAYRFEGQLAVFDAAEGPCYACVFPERGGESALDCSIVGVLGPVTGVVGAMQAVEVIKILTGVADSIVGRLDLYDSRTQVVESVHIRKNPACTVCGELQ